MEDIGNIKDYLEDEAPCKGAMDFRQDFPKFVIEDNYKF